MEYRGYKIARHSNLMGYGISHVGRGSLHNSLKGSFTDARVAKAFIDAYKGEGVDAPTEASSGDEQVRGRSSNRRKSSNDT